MTISKIGFNIMGTTSFTAKFAGMRKEQEFIVYPIAKDSDTAVIMCQSESRWLEIDSTTGKCEITSAQSGHHNRWLLQMQQMRGKSISFTLPAADLQALKMHIFVTADKKAGSSVILSDNSGAINII
jgi:hypothetical protein